MPLNAALNAILQAIIDVAVALHQPYSPVSLFRHVAFRHVVFCPIAFRFVMFRSVARHFAFRCLCCMNLFRSVKWIRFVSFRCFVDLFFRSESAFTQPIFLA